MKFVNAIYAGENLVRKLWLLTFGLSIATAMLFSSTMHLVFRDPLVVERACASRVIQTSALSTTKSEVESFIREALSARFDTDRDRPSLMTIAQSETKQKELKEFQAKKISQTVFLDHIDLKNNGEFRATLTRLLRVGTIRTALGFEIEAKIFETRRTEDNPYGLILSEVKPIEEEVKK